MDPEDVKALRRMAPAQRLERGLQFTEQARELKAASLHVHHPGWTEEQITRGVALWVRVGMKSGELY
jgi:hypothetical protein